MRIIQGGMDDVMSAAPKVDTLLAQLNGDPADLLELQLTNMTEMQKRLTRLVLAELRAMRLVGQPVAQVQPDKLIELLSKAQQASMASKSTFDELADLLVGGGGR